MERKAGPRQKTTRAPREQFRREIAGLALITASILVLASLVWHARGPIPEAVSWLLRVVAGLGAYAVPATMLVLGCRMALNAAPWRTRDIALGSSLLCITILTFLALLVPRGDEWQMGLLVDRGGALGATLGWILRRIFGEAGSYIILAGMAATAILQLSDVRLKDIASTLAESGVQLWERIRPSRERRAKQLRRQKREGSARPEVGSESGSVSEAEQHAARVRTTKANPAEEPQQLELLEATDAAGGEGNGGGERARRPSAPFADLKLPPIDLLDAPTGEADSEDGTETTDNIVLVEDTLASFGISAKVVHHERGPAVTRYEVEPARGIRVSRIANLADDLALALAAIDVRVEAPVPGKSVIGIEVPNKRVAIVPLRSILETDAYRHADSKTCFGLGKDIPGHPVIADLTMMPHMLISGATNAGKSVCLNAIIASILYRATPAEVQFIIIDPKRVELTAYDGIPHLMAPIVQTAEEAADTLRKVIAEMQRRYDVFALTSVRDVGEYNAAVSAEERLPYVVIVIDELADLMMQAAAEFEFSICRIAQLARATGIHLVVATQRPSVNVITGTIKANIPSRIAFAVASQVDSRTILDANGAERLVGRGDMLFAPVYASKSMRVQGAFVSPQEIERIVEYLRAQGEPQFSIVPEFPTDDVALGGADDIEDEPLFAPAAEFVTAHDEASVSMIQRRFKVGYARAGRLIDMMEKRGIVGSYEGSKPRQVLMSLGQLHVLLGGDEPAGAPELAHSMASAEQPTEGPSHNPALG
ncbi:MAG: DNA translocase FtsK 4TM domain-containing protein [Armatimonadota bacterium]